MVDLWPLPCVQEEYLEAVSEQEQAKKQLDTVHEQAKLLGAEVDKESKEMNSLLALYDEQDQILGEISGGFFSIQTGIWYCHNDILRI